MAVDLMQMTDMDKIAASREHALAMTRDYISQPRLSEWMSALKYLANHRLFFKTYLDLIIMFF